MEKTLYPKTKRVGSSSSTIVVTEKLDGSNVGFFKLHDELVIATRSNVFELSDVPMYKHLLCKGMQGWLDEHGETLKNSLHEGSGFFGEWIGQGKLLYPNLDKRVYMFAKANIDEDLEIMNLYYDLELLKYPFIDAVIPEFIGIVPVVKKYDMYPSVETLNGLYEQYRAEQGRDIEGFVVNNNNSIAKYVRMKNGKIEPHHS
jgi:hypothetical protein